MQDISIRIKRINSNELKKNNIKNTVVVSRRACKNRRNEMKTFIKEMDINDILFGDFAALYNATKNNSVEEEVIDVEELDSFLEEAEKMYTAELLKQQEVYERNNSFIIKYKKYSY